MIIKAQTHKELES